jgi:hypothetical protein
MRVRHRQEWPLDVVSASRLSGGRLFRQLVLSQRFAVRLSIAR